MYSTAEDGRLGIEGYVSTELLISISIPHMVILDLQRKKTLWKKLRMTMLHAQNEAAVTVLHEAFDSFRKHCTKVLPAALCFVWRRNPSLWARFEFYHKTKCKAVDETLPGCQPHTSSNKENMTSPSSNNKAPYRGVASSPNLRVHWGGGGGGGGGGGN